MVIKHSLIMIVTGCVLRQKAKLLPYNCCKSKIVPDSEAALSVSLGLVERRHINKNIVFYFFFQSIASVTYLTFDGPLD